MSRPIAIASVLLITAACAEIKSRVGADGGSAPVAADAEGQSRAVMSTDGSFEGEIVGTPAPGSRFAKVRIGMRSAEVERLIGPPDDSEGHITGKQFIPFFFGGDTHRREAFYKGEGILTYSPQHLGGESNTLIRIIADPTEQGVAH